MLNFARFLVPTIGTFILFSYEFNNFHSVSNWTGNIEKQSNTFCRI